MNLVLRNGLSFTFLARGHPNVVSNHLTTIEITKETHLTPKGDCVVAIESSMGLVDIPNDLKRVLSNKKGRARVTLTTGSFQFVIEGGGDPRLTFSHPTDLVIRKSGFISDRTLMIHADRSASDVPREMVRLLQDPKSRVAVQIAGVIRE